MLFILCYRRVYKCCVVSEFENASNTEAGTRTGDGDAKFSCPDLSSCLYRGEAARADVVGGFLAWFTFCPEL